MFLLELIQWIVVVIFAIRILVELYRYFNAIPFRWYNDGNQWAVITGGNDGIGFEFAQQLANKVKCFKIIIFINNYSLSRDII